jgi:hypothetical protein
VAILATINCCVSKGTSDFGGKKIYDVSGHLVSEKTRGAERKPLFFQNQ